MSLTFTSLLELLQHYPEIKRFDDCISIKAKNGIEHRYSHQDLEQLHHGLWKILNHAFKITTNSKHHDFGTPVYALMTSALEHILESGIPLPKWRYCLRKPLGLEYNQDLKRYELWGLMYCVSRVEGRYEVGGYPRFMYVDVCKEWLEQNFPGAPEHVMRLAAMNITEPEEVGDIIFNEILTIPETVSVGDLALPEDVAS